MRQLTTQRGAYKTTVRVVSDPTNVCIVNRATATIELHVGELRLTAVKLDRDDMLAIIDLFGHAIYETETQI